MTAEPSSPAVSRPAISAGLVLGALGVVFGDIGTSPLYTLQECLHSPTHGVPPTDGNVLGVVSVIVWSITLVVTIKYLLILMRADNRGEGGIMALLALVQRALRSPGPGKISLVAILVIIGAALLFGDGMITPAISVLSAIEGLDVATTALHKVVVPLTVAILVGLFFVQRRGTAGLGRLFGPVMGLWFATIAVLGVLQIIRNPAILSSLSPHHCVRFFTTNGWLGFKVLGGVVLCVTGGEALYADMGHFGRGPIRVAWLAFVYPALLLCYLGQGALLLGNPAAASQPFYAMVPAVLIYPMVALACAATVIASQALISGVFSLTHQAMVLGYFPRVRVLHTSGEAEGQIYVPLLNWGLAVACVALVVVFRESSRLASAYGLAVSGTMLITSGVFFEVARKTWRWPWWKAGGLLVFFLSFDIPFVVANALKFLDGGYLPFIVAVFFVIVMVVWRVGRTLLLDFIAGQAVAEEPFLASLDERTTRSPGTTVFLTSAVHAIPFTMQRLVEQLHVLPQTVILCTIDIGHDPFVPDDKRIEVLEVGRGIWRTTLHYGFMQQPAVPLAIDSVLAYIRVVPDGSKVLYVLGRESFQATSAGRMHAIPEALFDILNRNASNIADFLSIPPEQVLEMGTRIDL